MARARPSARSGVLVVDKAAGMTSFEVVARARQALGERRIGHAGTLDPAAVGVLPLLVGEATKMMPYLVDQDKEYLATIRLGITTDTCDLEGRVLVTAAVPPLDRDRVDQACRRFVGRIRQTPPMYSAVHHGGRRLYELARQGVEVAREPREVTVHAMQVLALREDRVELRIVCGKGTYVRALAADLGADLGCGGAVEQLVRVRVGPFTRGEALPSAELAGRERAALLGHLLPVDAPLAGWGIVELGERDAAAFVHGQHVTVSGAVAEGSFVRVRDGQGTFLGIGEVVGRGTRVRPERIVHADRSGARVLPA